VKPPAPTQAPSPPPAEPAPAPVSSLAPEPSEPAVQEAPSAQATTSAPGATPSTSPPTDSNWNKPLTKSASPTQAAAASRGDGPGFGDPGLWSVMAGVLLVAIGGLAFAWYGRNRLSTH
jgi:uncharacterized membrane protein